MTDKRACSTFIDSQACSHPLRPLHSLFPLPLPSAPSCAPAHLRPCAPLCTHRANQLVHPYRRSRAAPDRRRSYRTAPAAAPPAPASLPDGIWERQRRRSARRGSLSERRCTSCSSSQWRLRRVHFERGISPFCLSVGVNTWAGSSLSSPPLSGINFGILPAAGPENVRTVTL